MRGIRKTNRKQMPQSANNLIEGPFHENEDLFHQEFNLEQKKMAEWLENIRFRKQFFGGVSEQDVWKKIDELNAMYQSALMAERVRYDTLLEHYKKTYETTADNRIQ